MTPIRTRTIATATILKYVFGILGALLVLSYITFQARLFIAGPQITLTTEPGVVHSERAVVLEGVAQNITEIRVNYRAINTDEQGVFREPVVLENGYTMVSISAKDRYGRETKLTRDFVYVPPLYVN